MSGVFWKQTPVEIVEAYWTCLKRSVCPAGGENSEEHEEEVAECAVLLQENWNETEIDYVSLISLYLVSGPRGFVNIKFCKFLVFDLDSSLSMFPSVSELNGWNPCFLNSSSWWIAIFCLGVRTFWKSKELHRLIDNVAFFHIIWWKVLNVSNQWLSHFRRQKRWIFWWSYWETEWWYNL